MTKDRRLGRGLAALLGNPEENEGQGGGPAAGRPTAPATSASAPRGDAASVEAEPPRDGSAHAADAAITSVAGDDAGLVQLNVYEIDDNPFQPRRDFSEPEIVSLAESLKEHDMLQPVLVRRVGERYQLISGERRLRAAIKAGWSSVPARVREADDRLVAELAIVENLQRKDLNPIEKALSFKRYLDEHACTQDDLAKRLKIDRSTIANLVRLLELPQPVLEAVQRGTLTAGHARALLPLGDESLQVSFAERIVGEGLSVRETERQVQEKILDEDGESPAVAGRVGAAAGKKNRSQQVAALEQELRTALGTKVDIRTASKGRGRIVVHFSSHDEFERIHELLLEAGGATISDVA